jgi:glycosyltransferase involved in cell wall biosynthesis
MEKDSRGIAWVLFLEPVSDSLYAPPHLKALHGLTLAERWDRHFSASCYSRRVIIAHTEKQLSQLGVRCSLGAEVHVASTSTMICALLETATKSAIHHLALTALGTILSPVADLDYVLTQHIEQDNEFTWSRGLPIGAGTWVFTINLLKQLSKLHVRGLPRHPGLACQKLRAAVASRELTEMPFSIREEAVDVPLRHGVEPTELPLAITLDRDDELSIAQTVAQDQSAPIGLRSLQKWKSVEITRNEQLYGLAPFVRSRACRHPRCRPRVLYVATKCGYSGAEESLSQLVRKIDSDRFDRVALLSMPGRLQEELESAGASTTIMPGLSLWPPSYKCYAAVRRYIKAVNPTVAHLNGDEGIPVLWTLIEQQIPFVLHVRNGDVKPYRQAAEAASAVIAVSDYLRRLILRYSVRPERAHVIYDEADTDTFRPGVYDSHTVRQRYGIPASARLITMIARFSPNKRHDLMLAAFARVCAAIPNAHLLLKADKYEQDSYFDQVLEQVQTSTVKHKITHLEWVNDVRELHAASDVVVLCSDREGLGRCIVEAMATAKPVVVTDSGGSHEIIEHGSNGIVVPGGNAEALSDAIIGLLSDGALMRRLGAAARETVELKLDASLSAARVMEIYRSLIRSLQYKPAVERLRPAS